MAQKKIAIELTAVEAQHLEFALQQAQERHGAEIGGSNPAIDRVQSKLAAAKNKGTKGEQPVVE